MTVTTQQARLRFTTIPTSLQDAMFSEQTAEIMDGLAQQYHLDDTKSSAVSKIAGWVLLGFIHPEDVARELQSQLGFQSQLAADIAKSIDAKIFAPLKEDIAKAYAPAVSPSEESVGPKPIQDIPGAPSSVPAPQVSLNSGMGLKVAMPGMPQSTVPMPKPATPPLPPTQPKPASISQIQPQPIQSVSSKAGQGVSVGMNPIAGNAASALKPPQPTSIPSAAPATPQKFVPPTIPAPKPPTEKKLSEAGWSKLTPESPVIKLNTLTSNAPKAPSPTPTPATPTPASTSTPAPTSTPRPSGIMSEFDRLDAKKPTSGVGTPNIPSAATGKFAPTGIPNATPSTPGASGPTPPPVMLHEIPTSTPLSKSADIHFNIAPRNEMKIPLSQAPTQGPQPPRAAVLELGSKTPSQNPTVPAQSSATGAPKVVNYGPSTPPPSIASSEGPRHVTEITSEQPKPSTPGINKVTAPPPPPPPAK